MRLQSVIRNTDRACGGMLSGEVAKRYGHEGLPDDTIHVRFTGTAGQSLRIEHFAGRATCRARLLGQQRLLQRPRILENAFGAASLRHLGGLF